MNKRIEGLLFERGADIVRFVDISGLPEEQTQGFAKAVVFCGAFSKDFIIAVRDGEKTGYEFSAMERETDMTADWLADFLRDEGYRAYSQSEFSIEQSGSYDEDALSSRLPHKTIARLAGLGYIGKNNLLINEEFGCAFSMCSVLTDAPVVPESHAIVFAECGDCDVCKEVCPGNAIAGNEWSESAGREGVVDVFKCKCALKCIVNCPKTLAYAGQGGAGKSAAPVEAEQEGEE